MILSVQMDQSTDKPIKILAINSSPKLNGKTASFLEVFVDEAGSKGVEVERIDLYKENIPPVSGELGKNIKQLSKLQEKYLAADGFVIATPTYWFNVPGVLKNFIDSLTILEENSWKTEGKVAGLIVYSPEGGELGILGNLAVAFNHMGITIPPYGMIFYRGEQDSWAIPDIKLLVKTMIQQIEAHKNLKFNWD